jgi:hypothetical protein
MTQKEMQIIAALQINEVDYNSWGTWGATTRSAITHGTVEDVEIPYPHFYVYRETEDDENPWLNYGQNPDFPDPDLTLETMDGQTIDFYYFNLED